jgi:predicted metal-dependent phosphoesterase TrpH
MIDLHVHSYVSDGSNSPAEIIKMAYEKKIKAIALTDHDSVEGILEAEKEAEKYEVDFLKGIEISVDYGQGNLLHILGIGIDPSNEEFQKAYKKMKSSREEGLDRVIGILKKQGIAITFEDLKKYAVGKYLDRQAIPKYFVANKICCTVPEVWQRYLDPIPYGKGELLDPEETISIIKSSGGLSFLAHIHKRIGFLQYNQDEKEQNIKHLIALGLDGIERYYPTFTDEDVKYVDYLINKFKLIPTGGTDFHGGNRPEVSLGEAPNNFYVPDEIYNKINKKLKEKISI